MEFAFRPRTKFAMLAVKNVYAILPKFSFQLSDGTWVMPRGGSGAGPGYLEGMDWFDTKGRP
jgi:hypothetical protein